MSNAMRIVVVAVLAGLVILVIFLKEDKDSLGLGESRGLPRLVDFGSTQCVACKMLAPILDELAEEYAGSLDVVFVDVRHHPDTAEEYGIQIIPTQIFFDASGKELFRHQGFFSKEDMLAKWKELGVTLTRTESAKTERAVSSESPEG